MPKIYELPDAAPLDGSCFVPVSQGGLTRKTTLSNVGTLLGPGPTGPTGPAGVDGDDGAAGAAGPTGPTGPAGNDALVFNGSAVVDFGAFPGTTDASVDVTGQTTISSESVVRAWIRPVDTAVHSADEHVMAATMLDIVAGAPSDGVGFTIYAVARDLGGSKLDPPGIGRNQSSTPATAGANVMIQPTVVGSVGGQCLNTIWGTFTISWEWR